jgi:EAL domain-containing protein (putative c-di-GMP-specific phosphodiesterase class I)
LAHPTWHRHSKSKEADLEFVAEIKNRQEVSEACGPDVSYEVFAAALARLQGYLATSGVADPDSDGDLRAFVWDKNLLGEERVDDWLAVLAADLMLEPILTRCGPVHLDFALEKASAEIKQSGRFHDSRGARGAGDQRTQRRKAYLADMALVSPVLAAIGGFRDSGSDQLDIEVFWRPVSDAQSNGSAAFFEATLGLIDPNGKQRSSGHVMEAAERLGLVHILDHYLVTRAINELTNAPGAVSLMVSVSTRSLTNERFWCGVLGKLEFGSAVPHDLIIEVRDGLAGEGASGWVGTLQQLKRLGCRISLGNFGVCATSLRDAIAFAPDLVTIDKQFVSSSAVGRVGSAVLPHLVGLAQAVGAAVIIDGVDSFEDAAASRDAGALLFKGDWCGRPRIYRSWAHTAPLPPSADAL